MLTSRDGKHCTEYGKAIETVNSMWDYLAVNSASGFSGYSGWSGMSGFSGCNIFSAPDSPANPDEGDLWWDTDDTGGDTGPSGASGYSGYSGWSGYSGMQGIQGIQGVVGPSGPSGVIGLSGPQGPSGYSGWSGMSGYSGWSGISGYSGYSGISGKSGYSGWSGKSGYSGWSGKSGYSGISGYSGWSGWSGQKGDTGAGGALSELLIDDNKDWSGYDITNIGDLNVTGKVLFGKCFLYDYYAIFTTATNYTCTAGTWQKARQITLGEPIVGNVYTAFGVYGTGNFQYEIRRNGVKIGTTLPATAMNGSVVIAYHQQFDGVNWAIGDTIELWAYTDSAVGYFRNYGLKFIRMNDPTFTWS